MNNTPTKQEKHKAEGKNNPAAKSAKVEVQQNAEVQPDRKAVPKRARS